MQERSFRQDLTGSEESLDDLLSRLKAQLSRAQDAPRPVPSAGLRTFRDLPPASGRRRRRRGPGACRAQHSGLLRAELSAYPGRVKFESMTQRASPRGTATVAGFPGPGAKNQRPLSVVTVKVLGLVNWQTG